MLIYLNDAIAAFDHALQHETNVAEACRAVGYALQAMGRFEEAMDWHTLSINPEPDRGTLFLTLGNLFAKQQQWAEAIAAYKQVIQLKPGSADIYWSLANIYAEMGQLGQEVDCRLQALRLKPDWATPNNQFELGNWLTLNQRLDEAIDCYRWALQFNSDWFEVQHNLAAVFALQGNLEAATAHYQTAVALRPDYVESYYALGKVLERQERLEEAITCYRQAVEHAPDSADGFYALGEVLLKQCQWSEAADAYRQVIALQPSFSWAHHNLGYTLLQQKQWEAATASLQTAATLNANAIWTHYYLTEALIQQQKWQEAIMAGIRSIDLQPDLLGIYAKLGYAIWRCQQDIHQISIDQVLPLLSPENRNASFLVRMGTALMQQQQFHGASFALRLALVLNPTDLKISAELERSIAAQAALDQQIARHTLQQQTEQPSPAEQNGLGGNNLQIPGWILATARQYQFSQDWFTHNIPYWHTHLHALAGLQNLQALEIGSFEGMSACWLLDHILTHPTAKLTCIDLRFQDSFALNIERTGAAARVNLQVGNSLNILPTLEPESFSIIYIDGCHRADHVQQDATLSWKLLKAGGIMIFDDYKWTDPDAPGQDPKLGIDAFLANVQGQSQILHQDYQVILTKLA